MKKTICDICANEFGSNETRPEILQVLLKLLNNTKSDDMEDICDDCVNACQTAFVQAIEIRHRVRSNSE